MNRASSLVLLALALLSCASCASCAPPRALTSPSALRVTVRGGSFTAGLDAGARERAFAHCQATSREAGECKPGIVHHEGRTVTVSLPDFAVDALEVSQAGYRACLAQGACSALDKERCKYGDGTKPSAEEWRVLDEPRHPVVCATFAQAEAYCRWSGGRLPTEVEWERAARGGDGRLFPWGDDWRPDQANWGDEGKLDGHVLTAPVGSYPGGASPSGALDMVGNVWEWASRHAAFDEQLGPDQEVIRGGGFAAAPHAQRTTKRVPYRASSAYPNVGFRCAYSAR